MNRSGPAAVIVGLDNMQGLQAARLLARQQVPVIALAKDAKHFCCRTRVCDQIIVADTSGEGLIPALLKLAESLERRAVLFPCHDASVRALSRHRQQLAPWFQIMLPAHDVVEMLTDKCHLYTFAQQENLPIPTTFFLTSPAEAQEAARRLRYPCVLKPGLMTPNWLSHTHFKAFKLKSTQELLRTFDLCREWASPIIAQDWIAGPESNLYSCNCYFDRRNRPLATFIARKLRQWPPQVGQSSLGEECRNDTVLRETLHFYGKVGYTGLGYLEMKQDERDGRHYIVEPNIGRPTGRSAIAEAGGVALLYTMYCDAAGLPLPDNRQQTYGKVKWLDLRRDFQSALHYWRKGELSAAAWWGSWRGPKAHAIFSWSDPAPFLSDVGRVLRLSLSRQERRKRDHENPFPSRPQVDP
jgi:D-aspartate ligase